MVQSGIDGIPSQQIFLEDRICPTAEQDSLYGFHTIANRQNNIQAVVFNLSNNLAASLLPNRRKICDSWILGQFDLFKFCASQILLALGCRKICDNGTARKLLGQRIRNMLANSLDVATKQLRHLVAIQPHCLVLKPHIQPDGLIRLIHYNLVFARCRLNVLFCFHGIACFLP